MSIKFGTDGWRAIIGKDYTHENVALLTQATADYFLNSRPIPRGAQATQGSRLKFVVGYDLRRDSEFFAQTVAEVLCGNGIEVLLSHDFCPTPAVCFTIVDQNLSGGIMITASHNPPQYNGFKIKTDKGGPAESDLTDGVEKLLEKNPVRRLDKDEAVKKGLLQVRNIKDPYVANLKKFVDLDILKDSGLKVLVDVMHGTGDNIIKNILSSTNCQVQTIRDSRDVNFGGVAPEPIAKNLDTPKKVLEKGGFDICIVTDGDADRVGAIKPDAHILSTHKIIALLLLHLVEDRKWTGPVCKTITGTTMMNNICKKYGLKLYETAVGFKWISRYLQTENLLIGGEESGGIGFQGYFPERDGNLSGLLLLEMMAFRRQGIQEILDDAERRFGIFHYRRIDTHYPDDKKKKLFETLDRERPKAIGGLKIAEVKDFDGRKFIFENGSWLILRLSGTEPILRIYAEGPTVDETQRILQEGKRIADSI